MSTTTRPSTAPNTDPDGRPRRPGTHSVRAARPRTRTLVGAALVVALLLAAATVAGLRGTGWQDWFRHRPPSFTELSFTDPASLPTTYAPGEELVLDVTLVNHRPARATLGYRVVVTTGGRAAVAPGSADAVTLEPGASGRVRLPVTVTGRGDVEVAVELVDAAAAATPPAGTAQHVDVLLTQDPA